jgi:NAD(P)H dehydrogenase (quinone)
VHGGSPYGCGTIAGSDGSRMPTDLEKKIATHHGAHFGGVVCKLAK